MLERQLDRKRKQQAKMERASESGRRHPLDILMLEGKLLRRLRLREDQVSKRKSRKKSKCKGKSLCSRVATAAGCEE